MSDIFLSYANEDLAKALEARGWSVWWGGPPGPQPPPLVGFFRRIGKARLHYFGIVLYRRRVPHIGREYRWSSAWGATGGSPADQGVRPTFGWS